jgi:hypothetical protein
MSRRRARPSCKTTSPRTPASGCASDQPPAVNAS